MTRVLVTGVGGFVGSHVLETLLAETEWEIVAVDSFRHNGAFDRAATAIHPGLGPSRERGGRVVVMAHDLAVPFSPRQLLGIGKLDYIVHIASRCSVAESIEDPADFVRNNIDSTLTVLELARKQWCWQDRDVRLFDHRLIHLSTDEVYGPASPDRASGYSIHCPSSPYAASKAAQEDLVHAWNRTYFIPTTVVSSANMFGERQSQLAFIPRVIRAARDGQIVKIHAWHDAPGRRRYTYVRNTAQAIADYLTSPDTPGVRLAQLPLPGQHSIDNLTLAQQVADLIGQPLRYTLIDGDALRPGYDHEYAQLPGNQNWAKLSFDDGLERTVRWYLDHPEWLL